VSCRKGSAEGKINDRAAQFAKIRPMRVEMFLLNQHLRGFRNLVGVGLVKTLQRTAGRLPNRRWYLPS